MRSRLFISISVFGIIILTIASGCLQPKATVDLSEYKNEVFGYSLQYPSTCTFGPMPKGCKQGPPKERPQECFCFLNAEDPYRVIMQSYLGDIEQGLTFAEFSIVSYEISLFDPPTGTKLASWLKENFGGMYDEIPDEPNTTIDGIPAIEIFLHRTPMAPSRLEIYFIQENRLFQISMLYVEEENKIVVKE
ncbi:MAG: hypothetical protein AMJ53_13555 [Gammaproteobacteria bacterium SG8_11]|nr:MAG: hypothetical protein AMJ53_13555 [Gammaproteobacteria bacterium SG8_11]